MVRRRQGANSSTTRRVRALFFSILATRTAPISAVFFTCVPPHGCRSTSCNPQQAHAAEADRRADAHRLHELRVGQHLLVGDPLAADRVAFRDQAVESGLHFALVEQVGHREVESRIVAGDAATIDQLPHDRAQQVGGRMEPHMAQAPIPVDLGMHGRARSQAIAPIAGGIEQVQGVVRRGVFALALAGIHDPQPRTVGRHQPAAVAGLAAAERIEHGAVEFDSLLRDASDHRIAGPQVGIAAEECLGHRGRLRATISMVRCPR